MFPFILLLCFCGGAFPNEVPSENIACLSSAERKSEKGCFGAWICVLKVEEHEGSGPAVGGRGPGSTVIGLQVCFLNQTMDSLNMKLSLPQAGITAQWSLGNAQ